MGATVIRRLLDRIIRRNERKLAEIDDDMRRLLVEYDRLGFGDHPAAVSMREWIHNRHVTPWVQETYEAEHGRPVPPEWLALQPIPQTLRVPAGTPVLLLCDDDTTLPVIIGEPLPAHAIRRVVRGVIYGDTLYNVYPPKAIGPHDIVNFKPEWGLWEN